MAIDDFRTQAEVMRGLLGDLGVTREDYLNADKAKVKKAKESVEAELAADPLVAPQHYASVIKDEKGTFGLLKDAFFGEMKGPLAAMFAPEYVAKKQQYATDLKAYAGAEEERLKLGVMDPQVESYARLFDEIDPKRAAYIRAANSVKEFDGNDRVISEGQSLLNGFDGSVMATGPEKLTTAQKNWNFRQGLEGGSEDQANFDGFVRAPQNINGTIMNPLTGKPVGGSRESYLENTAEQTSAEALANSDAQYGADTFLGASDVYKNSWEQSQIINERIANVDQAIDLFDPDNPNALDTGPIKGGIFKIFGVGQEGMATIENMSIQETMEWLINFKGPTTDYEFDKSSAAAFANIMKGEEVNAEQLAIVRQTLEKVARLNNAKGEAAYGTLQDYLGEPGKPGDRSQDFESINKNYAPWFEPKGSQEGIIDGVPTFARFSADMEKRAKDAGTVMSAADIRKLYNQHYPTPRK
jgi:hypothetical protein